MLSPQGQNPDSPGKYADSDRVAQSLGWSVQRKAVTLPTLFCAGSFLVAVCGIETTGAILLNPGSFLFLSDKTGHLCVPPVYSDTHRYNTINLNIKGKTQRCLE